MFRFNTKFLSIIIKFKFRDQIPELYNLANTNYQGTYIRIARDTILKIAGKYNATSYWTERLKIQLDMKDNLSVELKSAFARYELIFNNLAVKDCKF